MNSERRQAHRYYKRIAMQLFNENREMLQGEPVMVDVSVSGLCFEGAMPLAAGSVVHFRMHIPGKGPIVGSGRVRWTAPSDKGHHKAGMQFETFGWVHQTLLKEYLEPYLKKRARSSNE